MTEGTEKDTGYAPERWAFGPTWAFIPERIRKRITVAPNGCWLWTGALNRAGYGSVGIGDRKTGLVHRFVYQQMIGPIAKQTLDHLCRVRSCCNPAHLEPVSRKTNILRGDSFQARNAKKSECPRGHPYSEENTRRDRKGRRYCRACARARHKEARRRVS